MRAYLKAYLFSRCWLPKMRSSAKFRKKIWTYSSSRSSKVIDLGAKNCQSKAHMRLPIIVWHSNLGHILHLFWDTATYWRKIACFSYPTLSLGAPAPYVPLKFRGEVTQAETKSHGAIVWWKLHDPNFNRFWLFIPDPRHPPVRQTDRQTDAIAYMLLRAKNQFYGFYCAVVIAHIWWSFLQENLVTQR